MPLPRIPLVVILLIKSIALFGQQDFDTAKPWTYWWWMGSAVDKENITRQLTAFSEAGLGGVHIIPIYGAKGYEDQFLNFLGGEWLEMVDFTIEEAARLGLGVDMTLGTGWPYGGPWVGPEYAAKKLVVDTLASDTVAHSSAQLLLVNELPGLETAFASKGKEWINLRPFLKEETIDLAALPANSLITLFGVAPTGQQVKRAAPGGEGPVMDYFDRRSVDHYLRHFDSVFAATRHPIRPRAVYHDSYETYGANWTPGFAEAFKNRHGYDLRDYLPLLKDTSHADHPLILRDARATLSELLYTEFAENWTRWSEDHGFLSRYQAHGSPGNILDLYALADIPETESFGCSEFAIPGLRCDPDYEEWRFGRPSPLMMKFAASPAHLLGKPLVSSETGTWLANHFKVALKRVKPQIDELFVSGVNHVFYHGITYSPQQEGFPGWLFYASTNFGPTSHFWEALPLLNSYVENCQRLLQGAEPNNDILLYFPIDDLWTKTGGDIPVLLDVHHYDKWFGATPFGRTAARLWENGYSFDYVSDKQLDQLAVDHQKNVSLAGNSRYQVIVIPAMDYIPEATLATIERLANAGVKIVVEDHLPERYAGFLAARTGPGSIEACRNRLSANRNLTVSQDLLAALHILNVSRETLKQQGLDFIRKRNSSGSLYFLTNLGSRLIEDTITFSAAHRYLTIIDPQTGKRGYMETTGGINLTIPPGKSYFIQTSLEKPAEQVWHTYHPYDTVLLNTQWLVHFEYGYGLETGLKKKVDSLVSWTDWEEESLKSFTGKARYVASFRLDQSDRHVQRYTLAIDDVRETAEVIINGIPCGTIWAYPFQLEISPEILKEENRIEIIVQNLSANYLKLYDEEHPEWKKFYDINFVDITYTPFQPAAWEDEPSGLIGKVYLVKEK